MKKKLTEQPTQVMIPLYVVVPADQEEQVKAHLDQVINQIAEIQHWDFHDTQSQE